MLHMIYKRIIFRVHDVSVARMTASMKVSLTEMNGILCPVSFSLLFIFYNWSLRTEL